VRTSDPTELMIGLAASRIALGMHAWPGAKRSLLLEGQTGSYAEGASPRSGSSSPKLRILLSHKHSSEVLCRDVTKEIK
jgi:hypothetical protein